MQFLDGWLADGSKQLPIPSAGNNTARHVVEVVGELLPEWLARQRNS